MLKLQHIYKKIYQPEKYIVNLSNLKLYDALGNVLFNELQSEK